MPGFVPRHLEEHWATYAQQLMKLISPAKGADELPVILIDNVADYYYRVSDQENVGHHNRLSPTSLPPYPAFWVEHKLPKLIHSKQRGDSDAAFSRRCSGQRGFLCDGARP